MLNRVRIFPAFVLSVMLLLPILQGCSKTVTEQEKTVAFVNNEPVKLKDFQREISLRAKQNPSYRITPEAIEEQLNTIIDRRLMIQEAMRMGITKNDDFVRTIQTFWEQTLIRELIGAKNREWEKRIYVTDREISDYYSNLRHRITVKTVRADSRTEADSMREKARRGEKVQWERFESVSYNDVASGALRKAFELPEGTLEVIEGDTGFMVVSVERKDTVELPPVETLYSRLKEDITQRKKTDALEAWLKEVREKAVIEVNQELIHDSFQVSSGKESESDGQHHRGGDAR